MTAHKAQPQLGRVSPINPKTGRAWTLTDPGVSEQVDALQQSLKQDPKKAKAFLTKAGFLTPTGRLSKRYGG